MDYDQTTSRLALISFISGLLSVLLFQFFVFQLAAVITGIGALGRNDPGRLTGKWRAWVGLILGVLYGLVALARLVTGLSAAA